MTSRAARRTDRGGVVLRATIVVLLAIAVATFGAYYVVRTVMAPEWIRANVIPTLEARYGRRVVFSDFQLRPRSIVLTGVRVLDAPEFDVEGAPLLYVDRLMIGFDPLGLLRRTFLVEFVRFVRPELRLHEDELGRWNVASLFAPPPAGAADSALAIVEPSNFRLVITRVEVKDAVVRARRAPTSSSEPAGELLASDLDASVLFHPMTGFLDYEARGSITVADTPRASLTVLGVLDLSAPRVTFEIATNSLDVDALRAFAASPGAEPANVRFDELVQADVDHDLLFLATNLRVGGVTVPRARIEATGSRRALEVRAAELSLFGGTLSGAVKADLEATPPIYSLGVDAKDLSIDDLATALDKPVLAAAARGVVSGSASVVAAGTTRDEIVRSALGKLAIEGVKTGTGGALRVALDNLDVSALGAVLGDDSQSEPREELDTGTVTLDVDAKAKSAKLGAIELSDVAVQAKLAGGNVRVTQASAQAFGGTVGVRGDVELDGREPLWRGHLSLAQLRYEQLVPHTPSWQWTDTTGRVDAELELAGRGATVAAFLDSLRTAGPPSRERAFVEGRANIEVEALDLDLLGKPPRIRDEFGPLDLGNVQLDAEIRAKRIRLWKLDYTDAAATAKLQRNLISVSRIRGSISEGELQLSGLVDLGKKGFAYQGQGAFRQVETGLFARTYLPPDVGQVSGKGSASFEFNLAGTKGASALSSLALDGYVALHSGRLHESRLLHKIATTTGVKEFEHPELTRCGGDIHIAGKRAYTERLVVGGTDTRVFLVGGIGFDSSVDVQVWLGFSPDTRRNIFSRGIFLPYIIDDKGWTYVPFTARGTLKDPQIETTPEAVRSTAIRAIPDAAERIVRESSKLVPGGELLVGGSIDAVKSILGGLGRVLQANSARAKGELPLDEPESPAGPAPRSNPRR
jgi:uncharacterized protein involved in outer membrane biogenesis